MFRARRTAPSRDIPRDPPVIVETRRRSWLTPLRLLLIAAIWGTLALAGVVLWLARDLPRPETALDAVRRPSLTVLDRGGHVVASFGDVVGDPLRLSDLPPYLPEAAVAVEDRRFWSHPGFDFSASPALPGPTSGPATSCRAARP